MYGDNKTHLRLRLGRARSACLRVGAAALLLVSVFHGTLAAESGSDEELLDLSAADLRLRRNEVYARHGHSFDDPALKAHFTQQPWYLERQGHKVGRDELAAQELQLVEMITLLEAVSKDSSQRYPVVLAGVEIIEPNLESGPVDYLLQQRKDELGRCLHHDGRKGSVKVRFTVNRDRTISATSVQDAGRELPALALCMRREMRKWTLPVPTTTAVKCSATLALSKPANAATASAETLGAGPPGPTVLGPSQAPAPIPDLALDASLPPFPSQVPRGWRSLLFGMTVEEAKAALSTEFPSCSMVPVSTGAWWLDSRKPSLELAGGNGQPPGLEVLSAHGLDASTRSVELVFFRRRLASVVVETALTLEELLAAAERRYGAAARRPQGRIERPFPVEVRYWRTGGVTVFASGKGAPNPFSWLYLFSESSSKAIVQAGIEQEMQRRREAEDYERKRKDLKF